MSTDLLWHEASLLSPNDVCAEILAVTIVESTYSPGLNITVDLHQAGGSVHDDGRGITITPDRDDTMSHAERSHTSIYPCVSASPQIDSILSEIIWGDHGPLGPNFANGCPSYSLTSEKDGEKWSQCFEYGLPAGPPVMLGPTGRTGTTISFETSGPIDRAAFIQLLGNLAFTYTRTSRYFASLTRSQVTDY